MEVTQWAEESHGLSVLDTTVHVDTDGSRKRHGQVVWGIGGVGSDASDVAGIAWDWREVQDDVVAICDPMAVQSNLELVDQDDEALGERLQLLCLNRVIHTLPWQDRVCELLRQ